MLFGSKTVFAIVGVLLLFMGGCANKRTDQENYNDYLKRSGNDYTEYVQALKDAPLVDLTLPAPEGKEYHFIVHQEVKPPQVQQIKDDETLRFYGQLAQGVLPVVSQLGSSWINNHYNAKNQESMWKFFEAGGGGGYKIDSGGGEITLNDSDLLTAKLDGTGNALQLQKGNIFGEGSNGGGVSPSGSVQDNDTTSTSRTQSGGEDSNLVQ